MKKFHWKKIVTRETTLLERYLRMVGYAGGVGSISNVKVGNILTVSYDGVSEQYFDEAIYKRCVAATLREFKDLPQSSLFNHFGGVLLRLIELVESFGCKEFTKNQLVGFFNSFVHLYGLGRGVIVYGHLAEGKFTELLKQELVEQGIANTDSLINSLTVPTLSCGKGKKVFDKFYRPPYQKNASQEKLIKRLNFSLHTLCLVRHLQWLSYYHELAERVTSSCFKKLDDILKLTSTMVGVLVEDLKFYTQPEIEIVLRGGIRQPGQVIEARKSLYVLLMLGGKVRLYEGAEARAVIKSQLPVKIVLRVNQFTGQVAYIGKKQRGTVKVIKKQSDMTKMKKGNILVSPMTTPRLMAAVKIARAIVTDEGGITSHASIVAREFKIPCVIGTKIASQVLKDGDRVEVDSVRGIILKLNN